MKTKLVRSLIAFLLALGLLCGLCANVAFASQAPADELDPNGTADVNLAPPPVETPVMDPNWTEKPSDPTTGIDTEVPPAPPTTASLIGFVPTVYMLGAPEFVYDRNLERLFLEFKLSDAGVLELLMQKCQPILELEDTLAALKKHVATEHNPRCVDHTTEDALQAALQQVECELSMTDFSYVGTDGLIRRAEYILGTPEYKAVMVMLELLAEGKTDARSLLMRFSDEKLAVYREALANTAVYFFPAYVECVESVKFYFALPVLEDGIGFGWGGNDRIELPPSPTAEPACN